MAEEMKIYRLEDLSLVHFVKDVFFEFPHILIVNEFPMSIMRVPTISIVNGKLIEEQFELGNRVSGKRTRRWFIDIFGSSVSQRDDFAYKILDATDNGINVFDYNEGFPPQVSPTVVNHLSIVYKSYEPLDIRLQDNEKVHYRGQIILTTTNDKV